MLLSIIKVVLMLDKIDLRINELRKQNTGKDEIKILNLLKAELINNSKAKKPQENLKIVQAFKKTLLKSAQTYAENNLLEQVEELKLEAFYVSQFLPKELSEDEVVQHVTDLFHSGHFYNMQIGVIIGKIRGILKDKTSNGKLIADTVKNLYKE
jgi:uncharacterized protein YqeY